MIRSCAHVSLRLFFVWVALVFGLGNLGRARAEAPTPAATSETVSLDALFASLRSMPGFHARFREQKRILLLRQPLVSEGEIFYFPPHNLLRVVHKPEHSELRLKNEQLTTRDSSGKTWLDLTAHPALADLVRSFTHLLAGDAAFFRATYTIDFKAMPRNGWRLTLVPKMATLKKLISELRFEGRAHTLERMVVTEASGDTSLTHFNEANPQKRFSPTELKTFFP